MTSNAAERITFDMDWMEFLKPELLILVPVLNLIGLGIKHSKMNNRFIPLILGGVGIALAALYMLSVEPIGFSVAFSSVTQGILCAGLSVYANQIYKQLKKS